jgi:hypothetical protein
MTLMEAVSVNIEQMKDSLAAFIASQVEKVRVCAHGWCVEV